MALALESLANLNAQALREMVTELMAQVGENAKTIASKDREILYRQTRIDQLTHEMAVLKRWKFGRSREQLDQAQASLLDETIDADIAAIEQELQNLTPASKVDTDTRKQPKRAALPPELPRVEMHHEPESSICTTPGCGCTLKRIGEDVSEKLVAADRKLTHCRPLCRSKTDPGVLLALPKFWAEDKQGDHHGNVGKNQAYAFARQGLAA